MENSFKKQIDQDGVLIVHIDVPDQSVNTFTPQVLNELEELIVPLEQRLTTPQGVIFTSAKPKSFVNGADLFTMYAMDRNEQTTFLKQGQQLFDRIANLPVPTVAAINGPCLGGGLELALACMWRVASDVGSINIGLPESKLGILPAWGGTTRLTRMLGPISALPLLLAGKTMPPRQAVRNGLIDEVVRPEALLAAAHRLLKRKPPARRLSLINRAVIWSDLLTNKVCEKARQQTCEKSYGNYPALDKVIDTVHTACHAGHKAGLHAERESLRQLAPTAACCNLMRLFFLRQDLKKSVRDQVTEPPVPVKQAAVIGGGTMGAGIVHTLVRSGIPVRLIEVNEAAVSGALSRIRKLLDNDRKSNRLSPLEARAALHRVSPTTDYTGLKLADIVIEAVAEDIHLKREIFAKLDRLTRSDAVLASNTSSLSIAEMAEFTEYRGRIIGLHFFNPVPKMPLVEVVRGPQSADQALATAIELAQRVGKTPILVGDAPGFLVNRVLIPYLAEALVLATEGTPFDQVDEAMKTWGMPMGPFELLDQIGLDVVSSILASFRGKLGAHLVVPDVVERVIENDWLGRKNGRGFYIYGRKGRRSVNRVLAKLIAGDHPPTDTPIDQETVQWRLVLPMVNEAAQLLVSGVVDSADTIDLATVLGLGFAPFRGGLLAFAELAGVDNVVRKMSDLADKHGPRFEPSHALRQIVATGRPMQWIARSRKITQPENAGLTA